MFPFLPSTCCFRRNFVLVPHMSLQVHFRCTEDQTFLLVNLRQLMTASNVGPCTQAWNAKWAVFKITGFACKRFLLSSLPNPSTLFYSRHSFLGGVYMRKLTPARVSYWDDFLISYYVYMMTGSFHITLFEGTLHVDKIHVCLKIANIMYALPVPVYRQTNFNTETGGPFTFTWYHCKISYWSEILALVQQPRWTHAGVTRAGITFCGGIT